MSTCPFPLLYTPPTCLTREEPKPTSKELVFRLRNMFCDGEPDWYCKARIVRQEGRAGDTDVLWVALPAAMGHYEQVVVVKFSTAADVQIHHALYRHRRTEGDVIPLVLEIGEWDVINVFGSNAQRRRPWKIMKDVDEAFALNEKYTRTQFDDAVIRCTTLVSELAEGDDDWRCAVKNVVCWGGRPRFFDFDRCELAQK